MVESVSPHTRTPYKTFPPWRSQDRSAFFWVAGLLGLLWADLFVALSVEWEINEQYSYGYLVPFLGGYLLYLRWEDRPIVHPPSGPLPFYIATGLFLLALLPIRIVFQANPDWRLMMWAHAILVWGLSCFALFQIGGKKWIFHFLPAITFFLLAVPWPSRIELPLIQGLMRMVALVAVEFLNLLGIHAVQYGNLIKLPNALVGVEEACSGVRSIQSAIMASFFFGEWFRFKLPFRMTLIVIGLALSILLNLVRTITLTLISHYGSAETMERWHDPVGYFVYFGSFILIMGVALLVKKWARDHRSAPAPKGGLLRGSTQGCPKPRLTQIFMAAWLVSIGLTYGYYATGKPPVEYEVRVQPKWDQLSSSARFPELSPTVESMLRYNEGKQAAWRAGNSFWTLFFFTWEAGGVSSFAGVHRPEICLQAAGLILKERGPRLNWDKGPFQMQMETYTFASGEVQYHVFFAVWETINGRPVPVNQSPEDRLTNVVNRNRSGARQSLQIVINGMRDLETATAATVQFLNEKVTLELR